MTNGKKEYFEESIEAITKNKAEEEANRLIKAKKEVEFSLIETKDKLIKQMRIMLFGSVAVILLMGLSLIFLSPLKTSVPYLIRVDNTTGYVDKIAPYNAETGDVDESVQRYFLARYVQSRESYDWDLQQAYLDFVKETSIPSVFEEYQSVFFDEEISPLKVLGQAEKVEAEIRSITFLNESTAQVRILRKFKSKHPSRSSAYSDQHLLITLAFDFEGQKKAFKSQKLSNPLGLKVKSYKVDVEKN